MIAEHLEPRSSSVAALLRGFAEVRAPADRVVTGVSMDSRRVARGDLFLACAGERNHGLEFADDVVRRGAAAIAWESFAQNGTPLTPDSVPAIEVPQLRQRAGVIAGRFFGDPSHELAVVGVTGTNGKTSVTHLVAQALGAAGRPCGLVGTLGIGMPERLEPTRHTTPDPVVLQTALAGMRDAGAQAVAMEVSSHALAQARTAGIRFRVAVFTNLTRDHLDYHEDFVGYGRTKSLLFATPGLGAAVVFTDDAFGRELLRGLQPEVPATAVGTGRGPAGCATRFVSVTHLDLHPEGMRLVLATHDGAIEFESGLLGEFNASNLALAAAVLLELGLAPDEIGERLAAAITVPGRMERFGGGGRPTVLVDYAHTPDALEQVLRAARGHARGKLWCVFGCGGDRDNGKRPLMAAIAAAWADRVVVTDDNPRSEDPEAIIDNIVEGFPATAQWTVQRDRAQAIADAVTGAAPDDVVVVAGKGHEDYQLVGTQMQPFSDRSTVAGLLEREWA
ncbi:MAG: UDP-N-acetylmuramoyl-L-alanyl-D-glutamate--2,6-diaminopimelate ligase [Xanthomonadaceae bacterium]|nr:UDP-N-acetylmuramoyl-L-alanyl-D-glutamate--2,6-diaminopimelate ligase [Xanthomonadaceae bacterium]